ncbi:MAG: major capsid protein [Kiloniellaceae bacterium]
MVDQTINTPVNYPYDAIRLTSEINRIENVWGRINALNLFPGEGIDTTMVEIAFENGRVRILEVKERGTPGTAGNQPPENSVILKVPHIPHLEVIKPKDLQDKFVFGTGRRQLRSVDTETAKKLAAARRHHAITLEFMRMGALKGEIRDGKNNVIYNLFTVFNVVQKTVDFDLGNANTDVLAKCEEVWDHMQQNLLGETMDGVHCLVSREFYNKLRAHDKVAQYYKNWEAARSISGTVTQPFEFGDITFEPYRGQATDLTGTTRRFIAANDGHAYPTGTMNAAKTFFAPPDHVNFANTLGTEVFVSPEVLKHGKGVELHTESNPLPVWQIPILLVRCHTSS